MIMNFFFFFSSRRRHTRWTGDWSSDVCSSDIRLHYTANNMAGHKRLAAKARTLMSRIGFKMNIAKHMGGLSVSHQCGTVRFGSEPGTSALNEFCRAFDQENLFVVDASFFPSSAAVNPALTIAAQAIRVAEHMARVDFGINPTDRGELPASTATP